MFKKLIIFLVLGINLFALDFKYSNNGDTNIYTVTLEKGIDFDQQEKLDKIIQLLFRTGYIVYKQDLERSNDYVIIDVKDSHNIGYRAVIDKIKVKSIDNHLDLYYNKDIVLGMTEVNRDIIVSYLGER